MVVMRIMMATNNDDDDYDDYDDIDDNDDILLPKRDLPTS